MKIIEIEANLKKTQTTQNKNKSFENEQNEENHRQQIKLR